MRTQALLRALTRATVAVVLCFVTAGEAGAAWRIGLAALNHDGGRAILTYDNDWVEVDLASGATELLTPPAYCSWTSATYAPTGREFALTTHCVTDLDCDAIRAGVWVRDADRGLVNVAFVFGKRWNRAVWRRGKRGDAILVREIPISSPLALGLNDLGGNDDCDQGQGRFALVDVKTGRVAALDIAPRGWSVTEPLAAHDGEMVATLRATAHNTGETSAEAAIAALCAGRPDEADDWRAPVCGDAGLDITFEWRDGDWRMLDGVEDGGGRLIIAAGMKARMRETCVGEQVAGRLRARCVARGAEGREIVAPEGFFGDLKLSGDGRYLASLVAGRGFRIRRFDLFDLDTGEMRDLSALLDLSPPWGASR